MMRLPSFTDFTLLKLSRAAHRKCNQRLRSGWHEKAINHSGELVAPHIKSLPPQRGTVRKKVSACVTWKSVRAGAIWRFHAPWDELCATAKLQQYQFIILLAEKPEDQTDLSLSVSGLVRAAPTLSASDVVGRPIRRLSSRSKRFWSRSTQANKRSWRISWAMRPVCSWRRPESRSASCLLPPRSIPAAG
jgi:hypothetical protein